VVGSYAVYHSTKRNNIVGGMEYQTGKAFHIYRPHAVDADGVKVWCELDITEGELTVTVPEDFLNKASYPVVVDPTFGYSSVGASSFSLGGESDGIKRYELSDLSEDGDVTQLTASLRNENSNQHNTTFAMFSKRAADKIPGDRLYLSANKLVTSTSFSAYSFSSLSISLTSDTYWLAVAGDSQGPPIAGYGQVYLAGDTATGETLLQGGISFSNPEIWSSSIDDTDIDTDTRLSIYATYTPAPTFNPAMGHRKLLL